MPSFDPSEIGTFVGLGGTFSAHRGDSALHGTEQPNWPPNLWTVPDSAIITDGEPIPILPYIDSVGCGPEPAAIIGEPVFRASPEEAARAIKGFTVANDVATGGEFPGYPYPNQESSTGRGFKILPGFDPVLDHYEPIAPDELGGRQIEAYRDDERITEGNTDGMDWSPGELVAHVSKIIQLEENDVISLGEPTTDEAVIDEASQVTCRVEGIGELTNPIEHPE